MTVVWQWRSDAKPWDFVETNDRWTSYSEDDSALIEQAYLSSASKSILIKNYYCIDVKKCTQYAIEFPDIQRPIHRLSGEQDQKQVRQHRFFVNDDKFFRPFEMNTKFGSLMIQEWHKQFVEHRPNFSEADIVDAAIAGIQQEGSKLGQSAESYILCKELQAVRNSQDSEAIKQCAVRLYTGNGFLCKLVNRALREFDRRIYRDTLGPYCYLLSTYLCLRSNKFIFCRDTVYRGAWLHPRMIGRYRKEQGTENRKGLMMWLGFTSTTKSREVAVLFEGNTLFEIEMGENVYFTSQGIDISHLSMMPHEEEVLLPSGFQFKCTNIKTIEEGEEEAKPFQHFVIHLVARQCQGAEKYQENYE